ncbi:MAG: hypothetical protein SNJ76_01080 [Fimbriimonadaceae bacterium]
MMAFRKVIAIFAASAATVVACAAPTTLEEQLAVALNGERENVAYYRAVLAKFGPSTRPFATIVRTEARHEAALLNLYRNYGIPVPPNPFRPEGFVVPASVPLAAYMAADMEREGGLVLAELARAATQPDVRRVFANLEAANRLNHLPAFLRVASGTGSRWSDSRSSRAGGRGRGGGGGTGQGRGQGARQQTRNQNRSRIGSGR